MKTTLLYTFIFVLLVACGNPGGSAEVKTEATTAAIDSATVAAQQPGKPGQELVKGAYCKAIAEYIKAAYKKDKILPDTLFIGRHPDFPAIDLPAVIEGANILLLTHEEAQKKNGYHSSMIYLNVMGWPEKDKQEFLIVAFIDFKPQHNCSVYLKHAAEGNEFELDSLGFDYPYGRQVKNHRIRPSTSMRGRSIRDQASAQIAQGADL